MSTTEFPPPGPGAGINSQVAANRAKQAVLRNSRFLCWVTMSGSFFAAIMCVCMVLIVFSFAFPTSELTADRGWHAFKWGIGALSMGFICPRLWSLGRAMADYQVLLDNRGVTFNLGTKRKPSDLFLAWEQIDAIKHRRNANVHQYYVLGKNGSEARFSSYTFFRPKKVARLIADRTGLAIQKA